MKKRWNLGGAVGIAGLIAILVFFAALWDGFNGNPVSVAVSTAKIKDYVARTYPDQELAVERAFRDFKRGGYSCLVRSPSSQDTFFTVSINGERFTDSYEFQVTRRNNTRERLESELHGLVTAAVEDSFPYETQLVGAELIMDEEESTPADWLLDMPFDLENLPEPVGVRVWTCTDRPDYQTLALRLLELRALLEKAGIYPDFYSMTLEMPYGEDGRPVSFDASAQVEYFPSQQLTDDSGLTQRILRFQGGQRAVDAHLLPS